MGRGGWMETEEWEVESDLIPVLSCRTWFVLQSRECNQLCTMGMQICADNSTPREKCELEMPLIRMQE